MDNYNEALEKAKAYDKALELMRDCVPDEDGLVHVRPSDIFRSLEESLDERTRKALLRFHASTIDLDGIKGKDILAWLEKLKVFADHGDGLYHFGNNGFTYVGNPTWDNVSWLEKQGEQKPAEKVEPQFKVGDWIVTDKNHIWLIDKDCSTTGYSYRLISQNGKVEVGDYNIVDEHAHLWTIQDAKDGDVLVCPLPKEYEAGEQIFMFKGINSRDYVDNCIEFYCRICQGDFYENKIGFMGTTDGIFHPATKEQRDILFQKMHEEGYEWNAEKKELKKIWQKPAIWKQENREELTEFENAMMHIGGSFFGENAGLDPNDTDTIKEQAELLLELAPKTEWSEEDEDAIGMAVIALEDMYDEDEPNTTYGGYNLPFNKAAERLKSIKQRHTWKPSDEQLYFLNWLATNVLTDGEVDKKASEILNTLYDDLKKLKGE